MLASTPILRVIGGNGAAILIRVMGMILAALSIDLVMDALRIPQWLEASAMRQGRLYRGLHNW